jgi:succinyl-CoA synthetase alpha subunit
VAILAGADTKIVVQGARTSLARGLCQSLVRHGTRIVGLVDCAPVGDEAPVFSDVRGAVRATGAELSLVASPPLAVKDAMIEAIEAGIRTIVCLSEYVPVHDALIVRALARRANVVLVGPNSTGVLSPGAARVGYFCEAVCIKGDIGVIAKSGSLAYAVLSEMKAAGLGASTIVGIGGDLVKGSDFRDHLALFEADPATRAVVLLGEIGGQDEERAAEFIGTAIGKPVVAFVSGRSQPPGRSMGHAGAIVERGRGGYAGKVRALSAAGARVAENIGDIPEMLTAALAG